MRRGRLRAWSPAQFEAVHGLLRFAPRAPFGGRCAAPPTSPAAPPRTARTFDPAGGEIQQLRGPTAIPLMSYLRRLLYSPLFSLSLRLSLPYHWSREKHRTADQRRTSFSIVEVEKGVTFVFCRLTPGGEKTVTCDLCTKAKRSSNCFEQRVREK